MRKLQLRAVQLGIARVLVADNNVERVRLQGFLHADAVLQGVNSANTPKPFKLEERCRKGGRSEASVRASNDAGHCRKHFAVLGLNQAASKQESSKLTASWLSSITQTCARENTKLPCSSN